MADPFEFIAVEAGTIPPSQDDILRRLSFLRQPSSSSPTCSPRGADKEGERAARFNASTFPEAPRSPVPADEEPRNADGEANVDLPRRNEQRQDRVTKKRIAPFEAEERKGKRALPPSLQVLPDRKNVAEAPPRDFALPGPSCVEEEISLIDLLVKFSKKPDSRLENVSFLDVLAMKGIRISPPRWWREGGYGMGNDRSPRELRLN